MVSLFALYYGVILKTELAFNSVFMGMRACFWRYLDFSKPDRFKILTYFVKNFYSLSKP